MDWALLPLSTCKSNCWWLGTVSFTTNLSFLQLKAPSKQSGSRVFGLHTTCLYRWVKGWPHCGRWIQDTPYLTSSGLAVVWCFPLQVHRVIPTPLSQAKGTNWKPAGAAAPDTTYSRIAVQWPTTAPSHFMDVSFIVLANHHLPFPCFRV